MILLDTHVVVWLVLDPHKLSKRATLAIEEAAKAAEGIAIAGMTLFEVAQLIVRGRIRIQGSLESFLAEIESRFVILALSSQIAAQSVQLPEIYPNDPIDRIIGATAIIEGLQLITADTQIQRSKALKTIW